MFLYLSIFQFGFDLSIKAKRPTLLLRVVIIQNMSHVAFSLRSSSLYIWGLLSFSDPNCSSGGGAHHEWVLQRTPTGCS